MHNRLLLTVALFLAVSFPIPIAVDAQAADQNEEKVAEYFAGIRDYKAPLTAFLHAFPKGGDLHVHPSGAVYAENYIQQALDKGMFYNREGKTFSDNRPPCGTSYLEPDQIRDKFHFYGETLDALTTRNMDKQATNGHDQFFLAFGRFGSVGMPSGEQIKEVVKRAAMQNISYLELMTTPPPPSGPANTVRENVNPEDSFDLWIAAYPDAEERNRRYAEAVRDTVAGYEKSRLESLNELKLEKDAVGIGYILTISRNLDPETFRKQYDTVMATWNDHLKKGAAMLVGVTILSAEDSWKSNRYFYDHFNYIFEKLPGKGIPPTPWDTNPPKFNWHGGELTLESSTYESMRDRISHTLRAGGADRIGHGVSIAWESDVYGVLKAMAQNGKCVEICLTSNQNILKTADKEHPFHLYRSAGVPMVFCTDDEGVSRSNLTNEYVKATQWFNLDYADLKNFSRNALEYSFLPGESLFHDHDYSKRKSQKPSDSPKAELQDKLEQKFQQFEKDMVNNVIGKIVK